jgi:hypothetical protein
MNVPGAKQTRAASEVACGPVRRKRRNAKGGSKRELASPPKRPCLPHALKSTKAQGGYSEKRNRLAESSWRGGGALDEALKRAASS